MPYPVPVRRLLALLFIVTSSARAQAPADTTRQHVPEHLFVRSDLYILGMFVGGTVAMFPLDRHLASVLRDSSLLTNQTLERMSSDFRWFGGPGPYLIGSSLFVVGRLARVRRAAELGLHGTEAVVVGQVVSGGLKVLLGRARP